MVDRLTERCSRSILKTQRVADQVKSSSSDSLTERKKNGLSVFVRDVVLRTKRLTITCNVISFFIAVTEYCILV